jgi:putative ABC transport system ATP-binding protein
LPGGVTAQRREDAVQLLKRVGLGDRLEHRPNQLSGGEQQRVAIARALVGRPRLILADEPTGNLDSSMAHEILDLLEKINATGVTVVMVTHETELANRASRQIHLLDGKLIDLSADQPAPLYRPASTA